MQGNITEDEEKKLEAYVKEKRREKQRAAGKKYYQRNREKIIEKQKKWNKENKEKYNAYQKQYQRMRYRKMKQEELSNEIHGHSQSGEERQGLLHNDRYGRWTVVKLHGCSLPVGGTTENDQ